MQLNTPIKGSREWEDSSDHSFCKNYMHDHNMSLRNSRLQQ